MAAWLPQRDAAVLFVDVAAIRNSGLLEKLVGSRIAEETDYRTFVERTGFDYKRDLDRAMLNSASGTHYFVLQGRFDWNKLRSYAQAQGGHCDGDYCSLAGSTAGRTVSFHSPRPNVMALATASSSDAAKQVSPRTPEKLPFDIPAKPVWMHVPGAMLKSQPEAPAGTKLFLKALESAERLMLTIGPGGEAFEVVMDVTCRTEEQAAILKAQLEGITAFLHKLIQRERQQPNVADLSGILTSGTFQRDMRRVTGRWAIRKAFLDSLAGS
jgi:hypothetical protein